MPQLIRKLQNKFHLDKQRAAEIGGMQADAFRSFVTTKNALSVYVVGDGSSPAERIVVAIAGLKNTFDHVDYAVFDIEVLNTCKIQHKLTEGETADSDVNKLHIDLTGLTADQLHQLALHVQDTGTLARLSKHNVWKFLANGIKNGQINKSGLNKEFRDKFDEYDKIRSGTGKA